MRRKKRELESVANQLETLARRAERISLDPSSYGTLWLAVLDGNLKYVRQFLRSYCRWLINC
jgi:hypothetical protein